MLQSVVNNIYGFHWVNSQWGIYFMYYLMLVRSALRDLWHEGCGQVDDTAQGERGEAECCITPQDHNPSAINHVKHELTNIKWFIVALWPTSS